MRAVRRGFLAAGTALAILLLGFQSAPSAQADETLTISGTLTDKNGPLGGLSVCAEPVDTGVTTSARRECVTSEVGTGAYTITNLVVWQYRLVAYGDGYPAAYFGVGGTTSTASDAAILDVTQPLVDRNIVLAKPPLDNGPIPKVTGKAKPGSKLTAKPGSWAAGVSLSYQWLRGGAEIAGATRTTYKVQAIDGGSKLSVQVTGSKYGYLSAKQVSATTKAVPLSKLKAATPKISGATVVGGTLKVKPGKWTAGTTLTYVWLANGQVVAGAASDSLVVPGDLVGKALRVKVTGTKQGYKTAAKTSKATKKVA